MPKEEIGPENKFLRAGPNTEAGERFKRKQNFWEMQTDGYHSVVSTIIFSYNIYLRT